MAQIITTAGIDVSKAGLDAALWPQDNVPRHIDRSQPDGFDTLAAWLTRYGIKRVGLEASGGYEIEAIGALQARGFEVVRLNARRVRLFAKADGRLAKNDRAAAAAIAHATAGLTIRPPKARQRALDPLIELLTCRRRLCDWITDRTNQLEHLRDKSLRRKIERRKASLARERAQIDKDLTALLATSQDWSALAKRLQTVPGVGPVLAETLIALPPELGTLTRRKIASPVGVAPFDDESGQHRGERHIQGGRQALRRVLFMATLPALRHNPVIAALAKRLAGKRPKVIIVACMRKLRVILNAIVRDNTDCRAEAA